MARIDVNFDTAPNPYKNIQLWHDYVDGSEHQRTVGTRDEWLGHCLGHQPDNNPSLIYSYDASDPVHPILFHCRAGCSPTHIVHSLLEKIAASQGGAEDNEDMESMTPPFTSIPTHDAPEASLFETTETPLWHLAGYCGVSYGWLKNHPALTLSEDVINGYAYYVFEGVPGEKAGRVAKGRRMPPTPGVVDKKTEIRWHNNRKPIPPLWPIPPKELPEEIAITEGETDCILARYWGFDAYSITAGGGTPLDVFVMEELMERGVKRLLIFHDTDATGYKCRDDLVRLCLDVGVTPVPIDLRLLGDPLLGGHKDLRDYRNMFTDQQAAHRAIREVVAQSESILDDVIPCFEEAYSLRTPDPGWLVEDIIAPGCITMLVAKPGLGKTTVLMAYAKEAREGGSLLDKEVREQRLLFATEEGTRSLWKKREVFGPMSHVRLHSVDFEGLDEDWAEQVRIMGNVARRHNCNTIIVDTLFSFATPEDEDKSAKVRPIFKQLRALTRQGFAVLVTMHGRKSGGSGGDQIAGSIAIPGEADIAIELAPADDGELAHRKIIWIKNRMNPDAVGQPAMTITVEGDHLVLLDDGTGLQDRETRIKEYLGQDNQWHTADEISAALELTEDQLHHPLEVLCKNKTLLSEKVTEGRGRRGHKDVRRYRLPAPMDFSRMNVR